MCEVVARTPPPLFGLGLSAHAKPDDAIWRVLACYKEGFQDPDARVRSIHNDRLMCTMSSERVVVRKIGRESYADRMDSILKDHRLSEGSCRLCKHFGFTLQSDGDCWETHLVGSEQH